MTKFEKVEAKIRELVPGLMGLNVGTLIQFREKSTIYGMIQFEKGDVVRYGGSTDKYGTWILPLDKQSPSFHPFQCNEKMRDFEIIGHPITLGDVLEAINRFYVSDGLASSFEVSGVGTFIECDYVEFSWKCIAHGIKKVRWIYGLPFNKQEILIDFLYYFFNLHEKHENLSND